MWWLLVLLGVLLVPPPTEVPPVASSTTRPSSSSSHEHVDWDLVDRARMDVNGDGVDEQVLVRESWRGHHWPQVAIHYADGRVESSAVHGRFRVDWIAALAVDDRPGDELLVNDILDYTVSVWAYRDGNWARVPMEHPGLLRTSIGPGGHGFGMITRGGRLVGYRSVLPFDVGWDYANPPAPVYAVDARQWTYRGGRLVAVPLGRWCVSEDDAGRLLRCS